MSNKDDTQSNIGYALEEIDAAIEFFQTKRPYHGSEKHTNEWHLGWETAAAQSIQTLNVIRNWIVESVIEETDTEFRDRILNKDQNK